MIRYVIVARLGLGAHTQTVYGTWETQEAADQQLARWRRRIKRTFSVHPGPQIVLSVEPLARKAASRFEHDFLRATGRKLIP